MMFFLVNCALDDALSFFLLLLLEVDFVDTLGSGMVIDGDDIEHLSRPNLDVHPAVTN
jgi:hypothetical protein